MKQIIVEHLPVLSIASITFGIMQGNAILCLMGSLTAGLFVALSLGRA